MNITFSDNLCDHNGSREASRAIALWVGLKRINLAINLAGRAINEQSWLRREQCNPRFHGTLD